MAMVINSNIMSLNAQRNLSTAQADQNQAMERLTSGKRINSAADDAAGLAISNRMTSQINGLNQAVRNANDGISLIQTAEGALDESTNILQRMRELSVQSSNGTYDSGNRDTLNAEVQQLIKELDRISETTSFNGQKVLDGSLGNIDLQVGSEANETIGFEIDKMDAKSLGRGEGAVGDGTFTLAVETSTAQSGASGSLSTLNADDLTLNGVTVPASETSSDTVSSSDNAASAISTAAAINSISGRTGVVAEANATTATLNLGGASSATALQAGDLVINGVDMAAASGITATSDGLAEHINTFSMQTGVRAENNANVLTFTAIDGRNIEVASDGAVTNLTTLGATDSVATGTVTLRSNEEFTIGGNTPEYVGLDEKTVAANETVALQETVAAITVSDLQITSSNGGDALSFDINGATITATTTAADATTADALVVAINDAAEGTGVTAAIDPADDNQIVLSAIGDLDITNVSTDAGSASITSASLAINASNNVGTEQSASVQETDGTNFDRMTNGDLTVNGYNVDFDNVPVIDGTNEKSFVGDRASAQHTALSINNTEGLKDEVVATAKTEANLGKVSADAALDANFGLVVNGDFIDLDGEVKDSDASGNLVGQLNAAFESSSSADVNGLVASVNDSGELLITADDGRNITVQTYDAATTEVEVTANGGATVDAAVNSDSFLASFDVTAQNAVTAKGTVTLEAKTGHTVGEIGGDKRSLAGIDAGADAVANIDISTVEGAQAAIDSIDNALESVNETRSELGAVNNRLDFTINNLSNVSENASAARSRIEDADFAAESANLSRAQVLQQAGSAMLAQANAAPQQVLSLLQ
ncbi:flagellin [Pontibacterium sp. N1Y112]|uniref:Flagellin n=1 Tax=Pontibacterium sinense TaxID=2781979 RepID=A0A8J7F774_9GAMM|nr:flagellin [Pontibacterium sinense]MBE9396370.1 flagellin [Pontibacterium sinense]